MKTLRLEYPVRLMGRVFEVSPSGFYAWLKRPPSRHARDETRLEVEIQAAHQRTRETYGPERLQKDLAEHGVQVGVHRIKRIRKKLGLRCRQKRKFKATTDSRHGLPVADNRLGQDFTTAQAPNEVWLSDLTYIPTQEGWLYRVGHKDLFTGEIGLCNGGAHDDGAGLPIAMEGGVHPPTRPGSHPSFGPWQPVLRMGLPEIADAVRVPGVHEPEGELLG